MSLLSSFSSLKQAGATLLDMVYTRLLLVNLDIEEAGMRLVCYCMTLLVALFCASVAVLAGLFLVVILLPQPHQVMVLSILCLLCTTLFIILIWHLNKRIRQAPGWFQHSMAEIKKDKAFFSGEQ